MIMAILSAFIVLMALSFHRKSVRVADATGLDTDSDLPKGRLDNFSLDDFQLARLGYLHCFIGPTHTLIWLFCFHAPARSVGATLVPRSSMARRSFVWDDSATSTGKVIRE